MPGPPVPAEPNTVQTQGLGCPAFPYKNHLNFIVDSLVRSFCIRFHKEASVFARRRAWELPRPAQCPPCQYEGGGGLRRSTWWRLHIPEGPHFR